MGDGQEGAVGGVSIHAPAGGATALLSNFAWSSPRFNPRPRRGGDVKLFHGVTSLPAFQSTPPQGGRQPVTIVMAMTSGFQSTPPQGGRPAGISTLPGGICSFNPRPRRGGDSPQYKEVMRDGVSIHAPAGGATYNLGGIVITRNVSIHAPAGGATPIPQAWRRLSKFQSTPPQGGRRGCPRPCR